jgi:hypothetical protein
MEQIKTLTKDNIKQVVKQEGFGFGETQIKNISAILKLLIGELSGNFESCSSGGNHYHMYFQMKDNRWIWFHSATGDVTISDKFSTARGVYNAFWDRFEKVTVNIPKRHKCDGAGEFSQVKTIANDILKNNIVRCY